MSSAATRFERADPQGYRDRLSGLLGERDPLDTLEQTPAVLAEIVASTPPETLRARPFAGKWTPNEVLGHLLDTEWVFAYRVRTILCDERPRIVGMDQERWVEVQRHNEREPRALLDTFSALRRVNVALWRRLSAEQLQRAGLHDERGEESLATMLRMEAGHDLSHIDQMRRYIEATADAGPA